jgi:hypothetical protein
VPPLTGASLGLGETGVGPRTNNQEHNRDVQARGESQHSTASQTSCDEEQQTKSNDADDEERLRNDSVRRGSGEYEPPPADSPRDEAIDTPGMASTTADNGSIEDEDMDDLFDGDFYS